MSTSLAVRQQDNNDYMFVLGRIDFGGRELGKLFSNRPKQIHVLRFVLSYLWSGQEGPDVI